MKCQVLLLMVFMKNSFVYLQSFAELSSNDYEGTFKCYVTLFSSKFDLTHVFVTLFSGKADNPHPPWRYVTLEWPLSTAPAK